MMDALHDSPLICKTPRMATVSACRRHPSSPIATDRPAGAKIKTEKNTIRYHFAEETPRLSLTNFQDRMKADTIDVKSKADDSAINFRLQGTTINANVMDKNSSCNRTHKKTSMTLPSQKNIKNAIIMAPSEQSNLSEFNRILSRMHLEQTHHHDHHDQTPILSPAPAHPAMRKKKLLSRHPQTARERATVNVINFVQARAAPQKPTCHSIYMKYFCKNDEQHGPDTEKKHSLTQSQLVRELVELKQEIAKRSSSSQKKPATHAATFTKYTTSFIEEKLVRRKSILRNYTFTKRSNRQEAEEIGSEFDIEGWNNIEAGETIN